MADTTFIIEGNLTRDPEIRYTQGGRAVARLGVAVNVRNRNGAGETVERTDFFDVEVWNAQAEHVSESLSKGQRVLCTGSIKQDSWEDEAGVKQSRIKFTANSVGPCLRWATAEVAKANDSTAPKAGVGAAMKPGEDEFDEEPF